MRIRHVTPVIIPAVGNWLKAALLAAALAVPAGAADDFVVVVNPSVAGAAMRRADLASVFLKKATRWGDRSAAVPVDQSGTAPVRKAFSEAVLQMPVATVLQYWQKQMFGSSPLRPPQVRGSDEEVLVFVAKTEGAVGYVSRSASVPATVKVVQLTE
jgi:ABC-type phosphate transport system substrate-binding protein